MGNVAELDTTRLVIAAIIGLALLLVLIIKFKVHAMLSILIGAIAIGLIAGMPFEEIVTAVDDGIGNTLKGIALLVGLGSMFGAILEASGGAQTLAVTMVKKFGDEKAAWALGITGLVISIPVFFDAGLIILIPLAFSLAKRTKKSSLFYAIPLLAGLAVGHAFIPPTPGPVLVATMLNVELGWVILVGVCCGFFAMIVAGPVWGAICGKKFYVPVPDQIANQEDIDESKLPSFASVVTIIMIPLVLIILKSVAGVVPALAGVAPLFNFLGQPFAALLICSKVKSSLILQPGSFSTYSGFTTVASITPPVTTIALISFKRPILISIAGIALSQLAIKTPPSNVVAFACASTRFVIASLCAKE